MRKLLVLLIAFIAVVTFIRAFDMHSPEVAEGSLREPLPAAQTVPLQDASLGAYGNAESGFGNLGN
jgi:hypothetical protein